MALYYLQASEGYFHVDIKYRLASKRYNSIRMLLKLLDVMLKSMSLVLLAYCNVQPLSRTQVIHCQVMPAG